jgi:hypothetical protein
MAGSYSVVQNMALKRPVKRSGTRRDATSPPNWLAEGRAAILPNWRIASWSERIRIRAAHSSAVPTVQARLTAARPLEPRRGRNRGCDWTCRVPTCRAKSSFLWQRNHMSRDVATLFAAREAERYALHTHYLNEQLVRVLKTVGFDVGFCRDEGDRRRAPPTCGCLVVGQNSGRPCHEGTRHRQGNRHQ